MVTDNRWPETFTKFSDDVVDPDYDMPPPEDPIPDPLDHGDYKIIDGLGKGEPSPPSTLHPASVPPTRPPPSRTEDRLTP